MITPEIIQQSEVTGALTDLLSGIIVLPMILALIFTKTEKIRLKRFWIIFLIVLDCSCFLGYAAHYFFTEGTSFYIAWSILLPLLFETFTCFFLAALAIYTDGEKPRKKEILIVHGIMLAAYIATMLIDPHYTREVSIRLLVSSGAILAIVGFVLIIIKATKKGHVGEKLLVASMAIFIPAAYFQIDRAHYMHVGVWFNCDGITHIFLIFGFIAVFIAALIMLKDNKKSA